MATRIIPDRDSIVTHPNAVKILAKSATKSLIGANGKVAALNESWREFLRTFRSMLAVGKPLKLTTVLLIPTQ